VSCIAFEFLPDPTRDSAAGLSHFYPGLANFLTVLSFNLLGDGLRDALDRKER
jgi:ABC-type dipeptide/oligopeptide/nickel transport system permease subunit